VCEVRQGVYGIVRSVAVFMGPPGGNNLDYIALGTDSGRLMILQLSESNPSHQTAQPSFQIIRAETFGKAGARRIVPGQYMAVDPLGRALMVAAIEKQRFIYEMNREGGNNASLTLSSPLSAHSDKTITFDIAPVDTIEENPVFAALEVEYSEVDQSTDHSQPPYEITEKMLVFYELDQGSHAVAKRERKSVDPTSNRIIPVAGGSKGPGGVLICSQNLLTYRNLGDVNEVQVPIPRRQDMPYARGLIITAFTTQYESEHPFILMQSECGDLYYVQVEKGSKKNAPVTISIRYFDTVPRGASIAILKKLGMLFVATEFGDHRFYVFKSLGDESDQGLVGEVNLECSGGQEHAIPVFNPHPLLHLTERSSCRILNTAPIIDFDMQDLLREGVPQYYTLTGRASQSSLRVLRHGLWLSKLGENTFSDDEPMPQRIFTLKQNANDEQQKYILVAFESSTLILQLNGKDIEDTSDTGLDDNVSTLECGVIGEKTLCQIHSRGINFVTDGVNRPWSPSPKKITKAAINGRQVVVSLSGGQVTYLEYDAQTGTVDEKSSKDMGQDVACLCVGPVPEGSLRSPYLGIGFYNRSAQVLSLDPANVWDEIATLSLTAEPSSMKITSMVTGASGSSTEKSVMHFNIGMDNGVLQRTQMSSVDGKLQRDTRLRVLGTKPVKLLTIEVKDKPALVAISSRTWLYHTHNGKLQVLPLNFESNDRGELTYISNLNSDIVSQGYALISQRDFLISSLDNLGDQFTQTQLPLKYTPRKICIHPVSKRILVLETDHNALRESEKGGASVGQQGMDDMEIDAGASEEGDGKASGIPQLPERDYNPPMTAPNSSKWASYIRIVNPTTLQTLQYTEIPDDECALSMAICSFPHKNADTYLLVGTAKNMSLMPRKCDEGYIRTYRFINDDSALEFLHKTTVEDLPTAIHPFQNRVLVGIKNILRLYDLGQKKLLRTAENKKFPNLICNIDSEDNRIYVSDVCESFFFVKYKSALQQLHIFADNTVPRWLTSSVQLDYDTLAGADKFGNFFVTRVPRDVSEDAGEEGGAADNSATGPTTSWMWQRGLLNGAPQKAQEMVQFHVGDLITGMKRVKLTPGTPGVIMYTTALGAIGMFKPFVNRSDVEFFSLLEMHMRKSYAALSGRDHLEYRSSFHPCRGTIDGDLLDAFSGLSSETQEEIARDLDTDVGEIVKRLEMMKQ